MPSTPAWRLGTTTPMARLMEGCLSPLACLGGEGGEVTSIYRYCRVISSVLFLPCIGFLRTKAKYGDARHMINDAKINIFLFIFYFSACILSPYEEGGSKVFSIPLAGGESCIQNSLATCFLGKSAGSRKAGATKLKVKKDPEGGWVLALFLFIFCFWQKKKMLLYQNSPLYMGALKESHNSICKSANKEIHGRLLNEMTIFILPCLLDRKRGRQAFEGMRSDFFVLYRGPSPAYMKCV